MVWFMREKASWKKHILDYPQMKCAYPEKLWGRKISELKEEEVCDTGMWKKDSNSYDHKTKTGKSVAPIYV